jgi:ribonuclease HI
MERFEREYKRLIIKHKDIIDLANKNKDNIWFTDGSCKGNGKTTATGGYASICVSGYKKDTILYGKLDNNINKATNIRAECTAIMNIMELLLKDFRYVVTECKIIIKTDSKFWISMLYNYMPTWSSTKFQEKSNSDLTIKLWDYWKQILLLHINIDLKHVYAHNKDCSASGTPLDQFNHDFNNLADMLAESSRTLLDYTPRSDLLRGV